MWPTYARWSSSSVIQTYFLLNYIRFDAAAAARPLLGLMIVDDVFVCWYLFVCRFVWWYDGAQSIKCVPVAHFNGVLLSGPQKFRAYAAASTNHLAQSLVIVMCFFFVLCTARA